MAKKQDLTLDDFDLDNDFNFAFDDIDSKINPDVKSKKRLAVTDVFKGTISGAKTKLTDSNFITKTIRESLPEHYGQIFHETDKITSNVSSLYDDTIRELKPQVSRIAQKVDKLIPEESRFFKKLSSTFTKLVGDEAPAYKGVTKEQLQEQSITSALTSIFDAQNKIDSIEKARQSSQDRVDQAVEQKRFTTNYQLLYSIDQSLSQLNQYTSKVTNAYQKKSLELQYRTFFAQADLVNTAKKYFEIFQNQHEAIVKNTALPDYVKIKDTERLKEAGKNRLISGIQTSLFGNQSFFDNALAKIKDKAKEKTADFKQQLELALFGLEEYESNKQQLEELKEQGLELDSKYKIAGDFAGSGLVGLLGSKLGKKIRERTSKSDSAVSKYGYKALEYLKNPQGKIEALKNNKFLNENRYGGGLKGAAVSASDLLIDLLSANRPDLKVAGKNELSGLNDVAPGFSIRASKSVTDVIPGYLSRILREVLMLRKQSDNEPLTVYDFEKGAFKTTTQLTADIKTLLKNKADKTFHSQYLNKALNTITGNDKDLNTPEKQEELKRIILQLSQSNIDYTPKAIGETDIVKNSSIGESLKSRLGTLVSQNGEIDKNQSALTNLFTNVKTNTPDLRSDIDTLIKAGYSNLLEEQGLIKRNKSGDLEIDLDKYNDLISSDINVKENIDSFNPKEALEAVKKTRIYNWFYKLGKGDKQQHTGPMAQDVKRNFGEKAAPGGKKIDLTTMNGVNMAAIQALDDKIENQNTNNADNVLLSIKLNTDKIVAILTKKGFYKPSKNKSSSEPDDILQERKGFYTSVVEPTINKSFEAFNTFTGIIKQAKDKYSEPLLNYIKDIYNKNKEGVSDKIKNLLLSGYDLATNTLGYVNKLFTDKIPNNIKQTFNFLKDKASDFYNSLDIPVDIYSSKTKIPLLRASLMKVGYYIDQTTGQVIKSIKDIKGPVVDRLGEVVLSVEDLAEGLVDSNGKAIMTPFEKLTKAALGYAAKGFSRVKNFYSNLSKGIVPNKLKAWFKASESEFTSESKVYDILIEIRDLIKSKYGDVPSGIETTEEVNDSETVNKSKTVETNKPDTAPRYNQSFNIGSVVGNVLSKLKSKKARALGGLFNVDEEKESNYKVEPVREEQEQEEPEDHPHKTKTVKYSGRARARNATAFNDTDGNGLRQGDFRERLDALKDKAKAHFQKADLKQRYRSSENILDTIFKQASGLFKSLTDKNSSVLGKIESIVEAGAGSLGLGKLGSLIKKLPGGLVKAGKAVPGLLGKGIQVAKTVGGSLGKLAKLGSVGSRVLSAGNIVRTALTVGSLATAGVGSTVLGAGSLALSALSAAIASPVVLGAAAIAATAYGGYRLYKYLTRDDVDNYQSIRVKQYGLLNSEKDKHHNHELLQLEAYLEDGKIGYDRGKAYFLENKIDAKEMYSIFDIDINDSKKTDEFTRWFQNRFKPFFLTHLSALYSLNNKYKLKDVKNLSLEDQLKYLSMITFESGPYDVQVSPFKDIDMLNTDFKIVKDQIDYQFMILKDALNKKSKKPLDKIVVKEQKPVQTVGKKGGESYIPRPEVDKLPNTNISTQYKYGKFDTGEDGTNPAFNRNVGSIASQSNNVSVGRLAVASGPLRDGESGLQYVNVQPGVSIDGLNPSLLKQFKAMAQEYGEMTGKSITVTSGYRSSEKQAELYQKDPEHAAMPGRSMHEYGLALDVNSKDLDELDKLGLMRKYGFTRPVGGEPWHTEPAGIQIDLAKAKSNNQFATEAVESSLFRGGGGLGSVPGAPLRQRDTSLAIKLLDIKDVRKVKSDKDVAQDILKPSTDNNASQETVPDQQGSTITASYTQSSNYSSGSNVVPFTPRKSNTVSARDLDTSSGYGGSISGSVNQSETYSKNDNLFEPEQGSSARDQKPVLGKQPENKKEVIDLIKTTATKTGIDPNLLVSFAAVESGINPNAKAGSSSASGLFQFTNATWQEQVNKHGARYGIPAGTSPFNARANTILASEYLKSNLKTISSVKPNPNITDAYLTHFLGPGGALRFLRAMQTNPDAIASIVFQKEAAANPGIFKPGGRAATIRQVYQLLNNRLTQKAAAFGIDVGSISGDVGSDVGPGYVSGLGDEDGAGGNTGQTNESSYGYSPGENTGQAGPTVSPAVIQSYSPASSTPSFNTAGGGYDSFNAKPLPPTSQGQGFDVGGMTSSLNHVGETLDKSLNVQEQILQTLKDILANTNSGNLQQVQQGLQDVANKVKPTEAISKPAVDLTRRSA